MSDDVLGAPGEGEPGVAAPKHKSPAWRVAQILVAVAVVAVVFLYAIPKITSYSEVWTEIKGMTPLEIGFLLAATALNLVTYWWANMVSIPNLGLWQAAVNNQTSTTVANTMPGGGYISIAVSYEMYRAWGFSKTDVGLSVAVTSVLNIFAKLALPAIALLLIIVSGRASGSLVGASIVGVLVLAAAVVLFGLVMWKKRFARAIGSGLGRAATWIVASVPPLPDVRLGRRRGPVPPHHDRLPRRTLVLAHEHHDRQPPVAVPGAAARAALRRRRERRDHVGAGARRLRVRPAPHRRCRSRPAGSASSRSPTSAA